MDVRAENEYLHFDTLAEKR